jgi:hypothetical protein
MAAGSAAFIGCGAQIGLIWGGGTAGRIKGGAFVLGERVRQPRGVVTRRGGGLVAWLNTS